MSRARWEGGVREESLTLRVSGWEVPAALTLPPPGVPVESAILLIPGSLFSDVNGDYPAWKIFPHVYAHLARQWSARGHAVYRYAKMGPGTGSVAVAEAESALVKNWAGRLLIAQAARTAMDSGLQAAGVAPRRTIVAGHSEGAVVASQLAAAAVGPKLAGAVLLAGPSVGILEIMREQLAQTFPGDGLEVARADFDAALVFVRAGRAIPPELSERPALRGLVGVGMTGQAYLRDCDATDPVAAAAAIDLPVLVVQGGRDTSVPPHHAEALIRGRGSRPTESLFLPELQHMFKPLPLGMGGMEGFALEGETDRRVADGVDQWIRRLPEPSRS